MLTQLLVYLCHFLLAGEKVAMQLPENSVKHVFNSYSKDDNGDLIARQTLGMFHLIHLHFQNCTLSAFLGDLVKTAFFKDLVLTICTHPMTWIGSSTQRLSSSMCPVSHFDDVTMID